MNRECRLNLKSLGLNANIDCLVIQADNFKNESNDWEGFVSTVIKALKSETHSIKTKMNQTDQQH